MNVFDKGILRAVVCLHQRLSKRGPQTSSTTLLWNLPHTDLLNWSRVGPRVCISGAFLGGTGDVGGSNVGAVSRGRQFGIH